MKKIIYFVAVLFLISSCSKQILEIGQTDMQPHYVTVKQLISLENGMSKQAVAKTLNVPPFEVYHSLENGCEVYGYIYDHKYQKVNSKDIESRSGLNGGTAYFKKKNKNPLTVRLYFKNNKLVDLITDTGESFVDLFGKSLELELMCSSESIKGCMDSGALNFNAKAIIDNNSCKYCPCDFVKNPNYDDKCSNSQKCISIVELERNKAQEFDKKLKLLEKITKLSDSCEFCDLINEIAYPYILGSNDEENSSNNTISTNDNLPAVGLPIMNKLVPSKKTTLVKKSGSYVIRQKPEKKKSLWKRTRWYLGGLVLLLLITSGQ